MEDKDMIVDEEVKEEEIVDEEKPEGAPAEEEEKPAEEAAPEAEEEEVPAEEEVKEEEEVPAEEEKAEEGEPEPSPEFHVEDTQEYKDLMARCSALEEEVTSLRAFKLESERKDKLAMIDSFYMLSDEEKADVIENVDKYSLDDIEANVTVAEDNANKAKEEITKADEISKGNRKKFICIILIVFVAIGGISAIILSLIFG